jgi:two-component system, NtrC family, response regulator HydG
MIRKCEFREDMFYRLNVLPIQLPPLRDRKNDIDVLASYFIERFNQQHRKSITGIAPDAMELLKAHCWPGNIRELENVIEHAFVIETTNQITPASLPDSLVASRRPGLTTRIASAASGDEDEEDAELGAELCGPEPGDEDGDVVLSVRPDGAVGMPGLGKGFTLDINRLDFQANKEEFERQFLISALKAFRGRINQTALHANIPKKTLLRKLQKYGINAREYV